MKAPTWIGIDKFWSQFEAGIDKTDIGQVAKLSYLKELLIPKVRRTIDGFLSPPKAMNELSTS